MLVTYTRAALIMLSILVAAHTDTASQNMWVRTFGGTKLMPNYIYPGDDIGLSVVTTFDDCIVLSGETNSYPETSYFADVINGRTNGETFVIKLDRKGNVLWKKVFGGKGYERGGTVVTTPDSCLLLLGRQESGNFDFVGLLNGTYIIKLDKDGNKVWTQGNKYGGQWGALAMTRDNGIAMAGYAPEPFVKKLDKDGTPLWHREFSGSGYDYVTSVATTTNNNIVITGSTTSEDGDFLGIGKGREDAYAIKLDIEGNLIWKKCLGGSGDDAGRSVVSTPDDGCLIMGYTSSVDGDFGYRKSTKFTVFAMKLDKAGSVEWAKTYGGAGGSMGWQSTMTSDHGFLLTGAGDISDYATGYGHLFVIKIDSLGIVQWAKKYGGRDAEESYSIATASDGGIVFCGYTCAQSAGDFGMKKNDSRDAFIFSLDSKGNLYPPTSVSEQTTTPTPLLIYPNPLSPASTITYNLEAPSQVRIELMNTLGQVVDVVFDGYGELGTQRIPLNVLSLTSGMYSVRMTNSNGVYTSQVCVVR